MKKTTIIKRELKKHFPDVKFSVSQNLSAGYLSCHISTPDNFKRSQLRPIINRFQILDSNGNKVNNDGIFDIITFS